MASSDRPSPRPNSASRPAAPPFHAPDIAAWLVQAPPAALDRADFGVIEVDDDGVVLFYNVFEAEFTGMAPEDVVGRAFFTDVAPCSNNPLFRGRFRDGLRQETFDVSLPYTLTYRLRPTLVHIRLLRRDGRNWILVTPRTQRDTPDASSAAPPHREAKLQRKSRA